MADAGERAGGDGRRQRGGKDEPRSVAAQKIDQRRRAGDIAADRAEGFAERPLDDGRAVHDPVALGNTAAARAVEAYRMHLVEVSHRAELVRDVAQLSN